VGGGIKIITVRLKIKIRNRRGEGEKKLPQNPLKLVLVMKVLTKGDLKDKGCRTLDSGGGGSVKKRKKNLGIHGGRGGCVPM